MEGAKVHRPEGTEQVKRVPGTPGDPCKEHMKREIGVNNLGPDVY